VNRMSETEPGEAMSAMIDRDEIAKSIRAATDDVFTTMLGLEVRAGEAYVERNKPGVADGVISLVGLAGAWIGTGSVHCSAGFACKMAAHMLGTEPQQGSGRVDEEVLDAVAEISNMIIGNVKNAVEERLGPMGLSIPTVIYGRNFTTRSVGNDEWTVVPFRCGEDLLEVKICLAPSRESHPVRHGFPPPHSIQV